jgi:hypothetical protein
MSELRLRQLDRTCRAELNLYRCESTHAELNGAKHQEDVRRRMLEKELRKMNAPGAEIGGPEPLADAALVASELATSQLAPLCPGRAFGPLRSTREAFASMLSELGCGISPSPDALAERINSLRLELQQLRAEHVEEWEELEGSSTMVAITHGVAATTPLAQQTGGVRWLSQKAEDLRGKQRDFKVERAEVEHHIRVSREELQAGMQAHALENEASKGAFAPPRTHPKPDHERLGTHESY